MKKLKRFYWVFASLLLYLVCIGAGLRTQATYTDMWSEAKARLDRCIYQYGEDSPSSDHGVNPSDLGKVLEKAEIIVTASAEGEGDYHGNSFLTPMEVQRVMKGDKNLQGKKIMVCEPIELQEYRASAETPADWIKRFGTKNIIFTGNDIGAGARTKIMSGRNYVLLLRSFYPKEKKTAVPYYTLTESPYAKLSPDSGVTADTYQKPLSPISFGEAKKYEILLQDKSWIKTFFRNKEKMLSLLNEKENEDGGVDKMSGSGGKVYHRASVLPEQKAAKIVEGEKKGPTSKGSEQYIGKIRDARTLIFFIEVSGRKRTAETAVSEGNNYLKYDYENGETYTGQAVLRGKNADDSKFGACVTGIAYFN